MNRACMINTLTKTFPHIKGICPSEDMGHREGGIFLGDAAEGGTIDDIAAYDYFAHDPHERVYILGTHKALYKVLTDGGWFSEPQDPGTLFAWED